ncbi:MAG: linear amide C-N hydrolase [Asgard group archaeon]|nr:linear amide C-N hydrolase [Asgard group archaeon]
MISIEKLITSNEEALTIRYLALKGSNFDIGKKLAEIAVKNHGVELNALRSTSSEQSQALKNYFEKNFPIYHQRMQGIAAAFKADFEDNEYDFSALPYNSDLPAQIGCSSIFIPPEYSETKEGILSRNYDFPLVTLADLLQLPITEEQRKTMKPMMAEPYIIELQPEDDGYNSLCVKSFDFAAGVLDGINSEGLTVCVNGDEIAMGKHFQDGIKFSEQNVGLNELLVMRFILDTCATVDEAKKALKENKHYFTFLPCHYLIADKNGKSFIFEYNYKEQIPHFIEGNKKPQIMTNHPVHLFPTTTSFPEKSSILDAGTSSFQRFNTIAKQLKTNSSVYTLEEIKSICESVSVSEVVKTIPKDYQMQILSQPGLSHTLWHCIYNCQRKELQIKSLTRKEVTKDGEFIEHYTDYFIFNLEESKFILE